jgi:hypothetical protein
LSRSELELPVHLLALEGLCFLLRHADEYDPISDTAMSPDPVGDLVLPLLVTELADRDPVLLRHRSHRLAELFAHVAQKHRRRDRLAQLLSHKSHQTA